MSPRIAAQMKFWSNDWVIEDGQKYGEISAERLRRYAEEMKAEGALEEVPPVEEIVDDDFIDMANDFDADAVRKYAASWK